VTLENDALNRFHYNGKQEALKPTRCRFESPGEFNTMEMPSLEMLRESHRILAEYRYEKRPVVHGYAGRTLYINLEELAICSKPVTVEMKEIFTGGR
jgi:hypothetical protein